MDVTVRAAGPRDEAAVRAVHERAFGVAGVEESPAPFREF